AGSARRRPQNTGVATVVGPRSLQYGADQDRHTEGTHGGIDLAERGRVLERVDVRRVLRPDDQLRARYLARLDLRGEGHRLRDVIVEDLSCAILEGQADVRNVALDESDDRGASRVVRARVERPREHPADE